MQDVITVSRQLQLMRSLFSLLFFLPVFFLLLFFPPQHRAVKPSSDRFELALSEADSVYYCAPALGSEADRGHGSSYLG